MSYDVIASSVDSASAFMLVKFWSPTKMYGLTTSAFSKTFSGQPYESKYPIYVTEIRSDAILGDSDLEISLPSFHPLAMEFQGTVPDEEWRVSLSFGHEGDAEIVTPWDGVLMTCNFEELSGTNASYSKLMCKSRLAGLRQRGIPYRYGSACQHAVYRGGCNLNAALHSSDGIVSFVDGVVVKSTAFALLAGGELTAGYLKFGDVFRTITSHSTDTVTLRRPINGLVAGSAVTVAKGCDRTVARCKALGNFPNIFRFDVPKKDIFRQGI